MTDRKDILIVCPQSVIPAWGKQIAEQRQKTPWEHQRAAAAWSSSRRGAMLSLDMGTGKSLVALMVINQPGIETVLLNGSGGTKAKAALMVKTVVSRDWSNPTQPIAVVINYDSVWRGGLASAIASHPWAWIVLDESHRIKSPGGRASRWLANLAQRNPLARLLCLTGTPMPHSPLDLYGQFRFLDPSVFGTSFARMRARYADCDPRYPSKVRRWLRQDEIASLLSQNSFRVTADEVLDLPDSLHEVLPVQLTAKTRKFYNDLERDMVATIAQGTVIAANALTQLLRMQQATSGYATTEDGKFPIDGESEKEAVLADWMDDLPHSEPIVVFCRFRSDLDAVRRVCEKQKRAASELSGRQNTLEQWQAGETSVLAVQIQSGGVGIDLTRSAYCVYYSIGFSLGDYEQSLARLRRPGQTRCVRYYHLVATKTVDELVYKALDERRSVIDAVLQDIQQVKA